MLLAILTVFLSCITICLRSRSRKKFPPGPIGLPIIGHLPFLGKEAHKTLMTWSKTYGPVMGISLGSYRAVIINDIKLIRKAMNLDELSARPEILSYFARGLSRFHGKQLSEQRRFLSQSLRAFSSGNKSLETKISTEISVLIQDLKTAVGQPLQLQLPLTIAVLNSLSSIILSETFHPNDPRIHEMIKQCGLVFNEVNWISGLTLFLPWLNRIVPEKLTIKHILTNFGDKLEKFVQNQLEKHQVNYVPNQPRDIADAYEDKIRNTTDVISSFYGKQNLPLHAISEMFIAGLVSVNNLLQLICQYLINYPDVQKKMQDEIDKVVGPGRSPSLADRPSMNYTEAVIHEILRHSSTIPLSVPRRAVVDVEFQGYLIPKDTLVIGNYYSCHFDKEIWGEPENFRPEHFLDKDGKFGHQSVYTFGIGKRVCIGESLAREQIFLFTTNLFQKFTFQPPGNKPSKLKPISVGFGLVPPPLEVILKERHGGH